MLWQTAWILATTPDSSFRDGARGIELARKASRLAGGRDPRILDALAAALAETGDFPLAVETAEQASTMALVDNDVALADAIARRARLYRQSRPCRQPASSFNRVRAGRSG